MENISHALYLAFAMLAFVFAFSVSLILVRQLNSTSKQIIGRVNYSYYDSLELTDIVKNNNDQSNRSRIVGTDTIIPVLYRYYKESFAVKILDESGNLLQYFDTTTEGDVNAALSTIESKRDRKQKALISMYDNKGKPYYMYGAPWLANINQDAKTRIDMYVNNSSGYINNVYINYSTTGLKNYMNKKFREVFTQYAYEGDTISVEANGEITSLTGNKQVSTKIIIIYQIIP